jgi:2,3-bisphosphoglycerate-dependent phosphoglycerate mutase
MGQLILLRHGQSQWNLENRFTGWTDVPLTPQGEKDVATAASHLKEFHFDIGFTSRLQRAQKSLDIILTTLNQKGIPVVQDSALNERHYGDLQGLNKAEIAEKYGQEKVTLWRRSYDVPPPGGESIKDCCYRVLPFFKWTILPRVYAGNTVLVAASGNSLRPMIQYLDKLDDEATGKMEIGLTTPYIYTFEGEQVTKKEIREIPGIVTLGASQTAKTVEKGTV